jgi:hypothetical protein
VNKYRARRTNGYASRREAKRAFELELLEKAGEISALEKQVEFELIPRQEGERSMKYIADFVYREKGELVIEDVKGVRTPLYVAKRKLMLLIYGIRVREV